MKKILICLLLAIVLINCNIDFKKAKAEDTYNVACGQYGCVAYKSRVIDGMEFGIFYNSDMGYQAGGIHVINLTKEKLEIEVLRAQLKH